MTSHSAGPPSFSVRPASADDAEPIAALSGQLGYPATPEQVRRRLRQIEGDGRHSVYVAVLPEGRVAGWIDVFLYQVVEADPRAEIGGLVVDQACRRGGAGRLLMARAEAWAREKGCAVVTLRSNVIRREAHVFYQSLGYTVVKTQHAFRKTL